MEYFSSKEGDQNKNAKKKINNNYSLQEEQVFLLERDERKESSKKEIIIEEGGVIDGLFFRRLYLILSYSGMSFFSRIHLYIWQILILGMLIAQLTSVYTIWSSIYILILILSRIHLLIWQILISII